MAVTGTAHARLGLGGTSHPSHESLFVRQLPDPQTGPSLRQRSPTICQATQSSQLEPTATPPKARGEKKVNCPSSLIFLGSPPLLLSFPLPQPTKPPKTTKSHYNTILFTSYPIKLRREFSTCLRPSLSCKRPLQGEPGFPARPCSPAASTRTFNSANSSRPKFNRLSTSRASSPLRQQRLILGHREPDCEYNKF